MPIVEGLDTHTVTSTEKQVLALIVNHKREHPVEIVETGRALLLIQPQQNLCVRVRRAKPMALLLQFGTEFGGVEDLAVENDPDLAARGAHRLVPAREIENALTA